MSSHVACFRQTKNGCLNRVQLECSRICNVFFKNEFYGITYWNVRGNNNCACGTIYVWHITHYNYTLHLMSYYFRGQWYVFARNKYSEWKKNLMNLINLLSVRVAAFNWCFAHNWNVIYVLSKHFLRYKISIGSSFSNRMRHLDSVCVFFN